MDIFSIITLIGGLALFLFGMNYMGDNLKKLSGGQLESILQKLSSNRIKGFFLGFVVTAIIQSSSATTVMLVGFVNSGIMKLSQSIAVIMGANVGTTVTAWLLSTTGIDAAGVKWLELLKPDSFTPILAAIGILMTMVAKSEKKKDIGAILLGFAVLMFGMETMSGAMSGLKNDPNFANILVMFKNPVLGILCGTILTAIIQSSSASIGILQALALTGAIPMATALPVILGQNIGTTITPILSSISGNKDSKRVAISCLYIKIIGVIAVVTGFYALDYIFDFEFMNGQATVFNIALVHTAFNVISTVILIPFCNLIEKLAILTFKSNEENKEDKLRVLDDRFLNVPGFALEKAKEIIVEMMKLTGKTVNDSIEKLLDYDAKTDASVKDLEEEVDNYEDKLGSYLVKLAGHKLSEHEASEVTSLLHTIGDAERISDHACNLMGASKEIFTKKIEFSAEAVNEIRVMSDAVKEIVDISIKAVETNDKTLAMKIEPLEQVIDKLKYKMKSNHIERLQNNKCTIELGFVYSDIITNFERIADHCSNIGVTVLQNDENAYEPHYYLNHVKNDGENNFVSQYDEYLAKYDTI